MGKALFQIAGVVIELERSMMNTRTKAGIEKATLGGGGRIWLQEGFNQQKYLGQMQKDKNFSSGREELWLDS